MYPLLSNVVRLSFRSPQKIAEVNDMLSKLQLVPSVNININSMYDVQSCLEFNTLVWNKKFVNPRTDKETLLLALCAMYSVQSISYISAGFFTFLLLKARNLVTNQVRSKFLYSTEGRLLALRNSVSLSIAPALKVSVNKLFTTIDNRVLSKVQKVPEITIDVLNSTEHTAKLLYSVLH
jgi:hypothetical protein